jgi:hypothetical protein
MLPEDTNAKMDVRILHEITIRHQSSDDLLLLRGAKGEEARDQASCLQIRGEILFLILYIPVHDMYVCHRQRDSPQ